MKALSTRSSTVSPCDPPIAAPSAIRASVPATSGVILPL